MTTTPLAHASALASAHDCATTTSATAVAPLATPAAAALPTMPATSVVTPSTIATLDSDTAAMLELLDMDLDVASGSLAASAAPQQQLTQQQLTTMSTPLEPSAELSAAAMKSQTRVTFLSIMKEFSESSCNATEMVERVDSLVHEDEHLLKLLPLTTTTATSDARRLLATTTSSSKRPRDLGASDCVAAIADDSEPMDVDSDDSRVASPRSVDLARPVLRKASADLADSSALAAADDHATRAAKRQRENDREMDAHDDLQRWIDLDLELDHSMDVFDFTQDQQPSTASAGRPTSGKAPQSSLHVTGFLRGSSVATAPLKRPVAAAPWPKAFDSRSATAALFGNDDDDDDDDGVGSSSASSATAVLDTVARAKLLASARSVAAAIAPPPPPTLSSTSSIALTDRNVKCDDETNVWGVADDAYEQDLLSSIDHSVLCDRENRFLQWDLEIEAQQQQLSTPPPSTSFNPSSASGAWLVDSSGSDATSPRELLATAAMPPLAKSPSHVDGVDDWPSLDFGTFQNRTVSHILSSCLHKRKLHHPYKHQVKLVNFNVSGDAAIADPVELPLTTASGSLGGSLATSLAFGGSSNNCSNNLHNNNCNNDPATIARNNNNGNNAALLSSTIALKDPVAERAKGEKKAKKREERKRLLSLKMQETFADLEGTFTEQDLDFKNVAGAGALSKMALAKLEALPLPDLSNLPQDLKELKRKIEATEHKVEGTKHRHRKGGPCPRCQVQNQLRAAKRAYHKRAVAHKKLPQPAQPPVVATVSTTTTTSGAHALHDTEAADGLLRSPPLTPTVSFDGTSPSLSPVSTTSSASPAVTGNARAAATPSLQVAGNASATATSALLQHRQQQQQAAAAQLAKTASRSLVAGMSSNHVASSATAQAQPAAARPVSSFATSAAPRRPCGNTFAAAPSAVTAGAAAAPTASPEPASPHLHHVTVTSA